MTIKTFLKTTEKTDLLKLTANIKENLNGENARHEYGLFPLSFSGDYSNHKAEISFKSCEKSVTVTTFVPDIIDSISEKMTKREIIESLKYFFDHTFIESDNENDLLDLLMIDQQN